MNPTTSLSMIYLREFERTNSTVRGQVRLARKAGHLLRMHWAYVRLARQSDRDSVPGVLTLGASSGRSTALPRTATGHPCLVQPSPTAQGAPA